MRSWSHAAVGAAAAVAPDVLLLAFAWRRTWLPETHPLVRAHRFLHSPASIPVVLAVGWATHVITDRYSRHRTGPCICVVSSAGLRHPNIDCPQR